MSNERLQGRAREKREVIQKSFRQGWQWVQRQLDDIRSKSAPPRSTRRLNPQPTSGSSLTSRRNAVYGLDLSIPPGEWVAPHEPMGQEIFCSSTSLSLWNVSSLSIEHSTQDDHTTPPREVYPNLVQDRPAKIPLPNTLPQGHVYHDSPEASGYGPVRSASPRSTRPSSPQPQMSPPVDCAVSRRSAAHQLDVPAPPSEHLSLSESHAQETLRLGTSLSPFLHGMSLA
ncbi:hypothetical protein BKA70DRAFT_795488 [Coprinopsis sp. MPI-PUGE-AT-0042]|nr:hypothetical protein BKA70DRAFT_795488 [Coprinopsis sp. MPI-PUGE-AT-0042]